MLDFYRLNTIKPPDIPIAGAILGMFSMQIRRQGLSHEIRNHVLRDTVLKMYRTILVRVLPQPVIFDVDVLAAFVMHRIFRKCDCTLRIHFECYWINQVNTYFTQHPP